MAEKSKLVGRKDEVARIKAALALNRNVLIEGPVGVGKTYLVQRILSELKFGFERVDGDTRYTEQKLTGWFDPPIVLKKGYLASAFIDGPLVIAMKKGRILFINELNRMPESVQNILLPAMDEKRITLPKLGTIEAKPGFSVVATQNPREFTATHALSEALLDRFEWLALTYQTREEEIAIVQMEVGTKSPTLVERAVDLIRASRQHGLIKRGASVRAAIAIMKLVSEGISFEDACFMALPTRIEMVSADEDPLAVIRELLSLQELPEIAEKKSELRR